MKEIFSNNLIYLNKCNMIIAKKPQLLDHNIKHLPFEKILVYHFSTYKFI